MERWNELKRLVERALDQPRAGRARWLARAAAGDATLVREATALLDADQQTPTFLDTPAFEHGLALMEDAGAAPTPTPQPGTRIGPYEVIRALGAGGMGQVLLAVRADDVYRRQVAIKLANRATDATSERRFRTERQILAGLEHPHIARLYDGGETADRRPYLVMEHVEGEPIDRYVERRELTVSDCLALVRKILAAVAFAHRSLVIHLDLKPANILVTAEGDPKLLDFGIARLLREGGDRSGTTFAWRPVTLDYASPEQLSGQRLTTASDVYSLGVLLYRLLAGCLPHARGEHPFAKLTAAVTPAPPSRRCPDRRRSSRLAGDLDAITLKALRHEAAFRYSSVEQLDDDLGRHLDGLPVRARRGTWRYRTGRFVRRHWPALTSTTALFLALIIATVVVLFQSQRIAEERDDAAQARLEAEEVSAFLAELFRRIDPGTVEGIRVSVPELLDRGSAALEQLEAPPAVRASLLHDLGSAYRVWGRYQDAGRLLEEALILRRQLGTTDLEVAKTLNALGQLARLLRRYRVAVEHHREALGILEASPLAHPLDVAETRELLGYSLFEESDPVRALVHLRQACAMHRNLLGTEHLTTARCLWRLAEAEVQTDDPDAAERMALESIRVIETLRPDGHPDLADAWSVVGYARLERRDLEGAGAPLERALALRQETLPSGHPEISRALMDVATWHNLMNTPAAGVPMLEEALSILHDVPGESEDRSAHIFYTLGTAQYLQGRHSEAEAAWLRSVSLLRRARPDSYQLLFILSKLAELYLEQGRIAEADPMAQEALRLAHQAFPTGHRQVTRMEALVARLPSQTRLPSP